MSREGLRSEGYATGNRMAFWQGRLGSEGALPASRGASTAELDIVDRLLEDHTEFRALFAQMQTAPTDQLGDLFLPSMRREIGTSIRPWVQADTRLNLCHSRQVIESCCCSGR